MVERIDETWPWCRGGTERFVRLELRPALPWGNRSGKTVKAVMSVVSNQVGQSDSCLHIGKKQTFVLAVHYGRPDMFLSPIIIAAFRWEIPKLWTETSPNSVVRHSLRDLRISSSGQDCNNSACWWRVVANIHYDSWASWAGSEDASGSPTARAGPGILPHIIGSMSGCRESIIAYRLEELNACAHLTTCGSRRHLYSIRYMPRPATALELVT